MTSGAVRKLPEYILVIDPGLITGLAWLAHGLEFWADEFAFMEAGTNIEQVCQTYGSQLVVLWERFDIRPRTPPQNAADAIEMIGVTRRAATRALCRVLTPAGQHTPKPHERRILQALGWWVPAKNDAQSAACHLLNWLLREQIAPPHIMAAVHNETGEGQ